MAADGGIKIYVKAICKKTSQVFSKQDVVEFVKPDITIEFDNMTPSVLEEVEVKLSFKNPLPVKLTGARFQVEGSYMQAIKSDVIHCTEPVGANAQAQVSVIMRMYRAGLRWFVASFQSDQLSGVRGAQTIDVQKAW